MPVVLLFSQAPNKHGNGLALPVGRRCFSFHPGTPHENNNNTPRPSYQSSSDRRGHKRISTFGARELVLDSSPAQTLENNPSPEVSLRIVPPMPALEHPALLRSLGTMATYPPHTRREITRRFTFGKTLRPYRSLPRVQLIFKTKDEDDKGELDRAGHDDGQARVSIPTVGSLSDARVSIPISSPYTATSSSSPPSSASSSSKKSAPAVGSRAPHDPVPVASNLYDPHMSIIGNVVPMQQDVPRVHDRKPLRSSLKASARPPIASSSSSNGGASAHMPSLSLAAANTATSSDGAVPQTPVSSPGRSETAKGKRKADDVDTTPPDPKKATFAVPGVPHVFFYSLVLLRHMVSNAASCSFPARTHVLAHVLPRAVIVPQQTRTSLRPNTYVHALKCAQHRHILLPHLRTSRARSVIHTFSAPR